MDVDTFDSHGVSHMAARLVVKAAQDLSAAIELADLHPKAVEDAGKFTGDVAAAHHQRPLWQRIKMEHLIRCHGKLCPREVGNERAPARGDQDVLRGKLLARGKPDPMRVDQTCPGIVNRDACLRECAAIGTLQPVKLALKTGAEGGPVKARFPGFPTIGARILKGGGKSAGENHQFLGHAAPDDTSAAHAAFLGQADLCTPVRRSNPRRADPAGTATDYKKVIAECHRFVFPDLPRARLA